ncbi:MAG: uracil-DNA glycosylase family protein [Planctomycetaceae bacterium]
MSDDPSLDLNRALRQQLEGWQRAGLSHLPMPPRKRSASATAPKTAAVSRTQSTGNTVARPMVSSSVKTPKAVSPPTVPQPSPVALPVALPVVSEALPSSPHVAGSRADREWRLNQWKQRVAACVRCPELASARHQTVFGVGNPEARFLFIGEAPGADEDAQGEPFVGAAGKLLDKIVGACGLKREDLYICNILRCRPPGNRKPLPLEAGNCREYLDAQIGIIDPDFIVCWGATAAQNLMGTEESIGRLRGRFFEHGRAKVLCTYHPSYLLRNPAAKKDVWEDMKLFLKQAGLPVPTA